MKKLIFLIALYFVVTFNGSVYAQISTDSLMHGSILFELRNDTLFSNSGFKIFSGQKLIIGNPSGESGRYRSIISIKAAIVPSIWGQNKNYENAIENYVDSKKNREKVKNSLVPGNSLTIKAIGFWKESKPPFYIVSLFSESDRYKCDIKLALVLKELLLQP